MWQAPGNRENPTEPEEIQGLPCEHGARLIYNEVLRSAGLFKKQRGFASEPRRRGRYGRTEGHLFGTANSLTWKRISASEDSLLSMPHILLSAALRTGGPTIHAWRERCRTWQAEVPETDSPTAWKVSFKALRKEETAPSSCHQDDKEDIETCRVVARCLSSSWSLPDIDHEEPRSACKRDGPFKRMLNSSMAYSILGEERQRGQQRDFQSQADLHFPDSGVVKNGSEVPPHILGLAMAVNQRLDPSSTSSLRFLKAVTLQLDVQLFNASLDSFQPQALLHPFTFNACCMMNMLRTELLPEQCSKPFDYMINAVGSINKLSDSVEAIPADALKAKFGKEQSQAAAALLKKREELHQLVMEVPLSKRHTCPSMLQLLAALCTLQLYKASANFVASLHANYVVNLDFDSSTTEAAGLDNLDDEDVKVMNLANGRRKFRCRLPGGKNISQHHPGAPDAKAHFLAAKLAPWRGSCLTVIKDFWSYDLCSGSKVVQYRDDAGMRFSLGEHHPKSDRLLPTGEVRELYLGGTDNRSTEVRYVCGRGDASATSLEVVEDPDDAYGSDMGGPAFCSWKDRDGAEASAPDGSRMLASALLEPLRNRCLNISRGWWTYEYCYPSNLVQFHLENDKRAPQYTLGTLEGTPQSKSPNRINMSMVRLKPSMSPRERRAPPSRHLTLEQHLGGGNETRLDFADLVCDETSQPRRAAMHFQCPPDWQTRPESRIVSVTESSLCEYEVLIHTTLLCGHHKLMPTLPRGKETIQCVADPRDEEPAKTPRAETLTQMDKPEVYEMKKAMEMLEPASKVPPLTALPFENPYSTLLKLSLAERVQKQKPELLEALMCISKAVAIGPACQELWWSAGQVFLQLFLLQDDADSLLEPWSQKLQVLAGSSDMSWSPCWRFLYGQARMLNQLWQCRLTWDLNSGLQKTLKAGHQLSEDLSHFALQWLERQLEMLVLLRCRKRYFARSNETRLVLHLKRCKRAAQMLLWFLIKCTDMSGEFHYTADVMTTVEDWERPVFAEIWCKLANRGTQPLLCFRGMDGRDRVPATYLWYVPYILGRIEWKLSKLCPASPERLERKSIICLLMDACHVELAVRASLTERRRDEIMETEPSFRLHAVRLAILFGSPDGYESAGTICFDTNCLELSRQNVIVDALKGMQAVVQENKCHMGKYLSCEARALLDSGELNRAADCVIKIVDETLRARKFRVPSFGSCLNPHVMHCQRARKAERQQWAAMQTCLEVQQAILQSILGVQGYAALQENCDKQTATLAASMSLEKLLHAHGHEAQHELHHYEESYWTTRRRDSWCSQLSQLAETPSTQNADGETLNLPVEEEPTSSICGCALSLVSTCVGSGLLALPFAFAAAGPLHGLGILAGSALLSAFVSLLLCTCCDWSEKKSYEELAIAAFGSWGSVIMELMVVWLLLGAMTSLLVIAGDCLMAAGSERRGLLTALDVALVILPLSCLQSPASLLYSNALAVSCTLLVGLLLSLRSWGPWGSASDLVISSQSNLSGLPGLLRAVPIVTLSLGCQVQVPCIYATLEKRSFKRMRCAILAAMGLCMFIYTVVALSGLRVTAVPGNVLDLFGSSDWLGGAMRAAISVAAVGSTVDHLVFGGGAFAASNAGIRHRVETLVVVCITLLLSTTESDLSKVFGFTGATAGAVICYVLPLCFYLRLRMTRPAVERHSTIAVAVLCGLLLAAMIPCVVLATWQLL
eukprot:s4464_g7.t2